MEMVKQQEITYESIDGPERGEIIIDPETNTLVPPKDYHKHKQFYDDLAEEILKSTNEKRKRTPSTIKHIFLIYPKDGFTLEDIDMDALLDKLFEFLWETCRKKDNPPRFKIIGKNIVTVEFLKPRRIDYDKLDICNVSLVKRPFKALYNSVDYLQLTIDKFLKKQ